MRWTEAGDAVSVVIPARNEGVRVGRTVASIVEGRSAPFPLEIIVVDDASSDGCCVRLERLSKGQSDGVRIRTVRLPRWSGIPYARNLGARVATSELLFFTDANVAFPQNWDLELRDHVSPNRVLCAAIADQGSAFRGFGGRLETTSMGFEWLRSPSAYGGYVPISPCTGTVVPRELFWRVGGYDTAMPVYGAAEPEFSVRLWLAGAEIVCLPRLVLRHRFRPAEERKPFLDAIRRMQTYNYLRFGLLYLDQAGAERLLGHYSRAAPDLFDQVVRRVWGSDVWKRRAELRRCLPYRFASFQARFSL